MQKYINEFNCQLAHRIPKTKGNIKKYGAYIIHHDKNLKLCCSLDCNVKVASPSEEREILEDIKNG